MTEVATEVYTSPSWLSTTEELTEGTRGILAWEHFIDQLSDSLVCQLVQLEIVALSHQSASAPICDLRPTAN